MIRGTSQLATSLLVIAIVVTWTAVGLAAPSVEEALPVLTGDDMFAKGRLVKSWIAAGNPSVPKAIRLLDHAHRDARAAALDTLAGIPGDESYRALSAQLKRYGPLPKPDDTFADDYLRTLAIQGLGQLGDERGRADLKPVLDSPNPYDQIWAAVALGRLGDEIAIAQVRDALNHDNADIRTIAAGELHRFPGEKTVSALEAALKDQEWVVRERAVYSLGLLNAATDRLQKLASDDPSPFVQRTAAAAVKGELSQP